MIDSEDREHQPGSLASIVVELDGTVRDALTAIDRGGRGLALLVDAGRRVLGTISDGDIRRGLLSGATLEDPARDLARRTFVAVGGNAERPHVLDLMRARSIAQVPILDDAGRLLGIHSLREIIGRIDRPNTAVLMAGGRGERLQPLTDSIPKPMLLVAGRPILEWLVLHLVGFGIRRIRISVNYLGDVIERHFGDGADFGCEIAYLRETIALGTGGSLSLLAEQQNEPVLVMNGDLVTRFDVGEILTTHERSGASITLGVHEYWHTVPFGVVTLDADRIVGVREKPAESWVTNAGIYVLEPAVVQRVPVGRAVQLPELIEEALDLGERVQAYRIGGHWTDIGRPAELMRARGTGGA